MEQKKHVSKESPPKSTIEFALETRPGGVENDFSEIVELSGWAVSTSPEASPLRLFFTIDGEDVAELPCLVPRRDIFMRYPNSFFALSSGFKFNLPFETLMGIGPGRLQLWARCASNTEAAVKIWDWSLGSPEPTLATSSESVAVASLKAFLSRISGRQQGAMEQLDREGVVLVLRCPSSGTSYRKSLAALHYKVSLVLLDADSDEDFLDVEQWLQKTFSSTVVEALDPDVLASPRVLSNMLRERDYLSSHSALLYIDAREDSVDYVDLEGLLRDYFQSSVRSAISCFPYGAQSQLSTPAGLHLSELSELLCSPAAKAPLMVVGEQVSSVFVCLAKDLARYLKDAELLSIEQVRDPQLPPKLELLYDLRQAVLSDEKFLGLASDRVSTSQALIDQAYPKYLAKSKALKDKQVVLFVLPKNRELDLSRSSRFQYISFLAESLRASGVKVFFISDEDASNCSNFGPYSCLCLEQAVDYLNADASGCIVFTEWEATQAANALRYLTQFPVAGFIDELPGRKFEEESVDKRESTRWAYSSHFVPLLRDPRLVEQLEFHFDGFKEALLIDEPNQIKAADFVAQIYRADAELASRLSRDRYESKPLDIIVPVYNALDAAKQCLGVAIGCLANTPAGVRERIVIVNDCSNEQTSSWLREFSRENGAEVLLVEHSESLGFNQSCKSGFKSSRPDADIVILNLDVVLTKASLRRLREAAYCRFNIAAASALSTNSFHLQMDINPGDSLWDVGDYLDKEYTPECPTVIASDSQFIYLRRWALEKFGFLDDAYRLGFCEDSDLSMRFLLHGADTVCAENSFVFKRETSSSEFPESMMKENRELFEARWGRFYGPMFRVFCNRDPLEKVRENYAARKIALSPPDPSLTLLDFWNNNHRSGRFLHASQGLLSKKRGTKRSSILENTEVVFLFSKVVLEDGGLSVLQHVNEFLLRGVQARVVSLSSPGTIDYPKLAPVIVVSPEDLLKLDWSGQHLVATSWMTAYFVDSIKKENSAVKPYSYIQNYESWFQPRVEDFSSMQEAEQTFNLDFRNVVKKGLEKDVPAALHDKKIELMSPGIDRALFYRGTQDSYLGPARICAEYRPKAFRRGAQVLLEVLEKTVKRIPEVEICLFGEKANLPDSLAGNCKLLGEISPIKLAELYRNADIVVDLSERGVFGHMEIESVLCGVVPLSSKTKRVAAHLVDGENCLLVSPGDVSGAVERLVRLVVDREFRLSLREQGLAMDPGFSEVLATDNWLDILGIDVDSRTQPRVVSGNHRKQSSLKIEVVRPNLGSNSQDTDKTEPGGQSVKNLS